VEGVGLGSKFAGGEAMATAELSPKSRFAAAVLCWLGGGFGLHRFYLGRKKSASQSLLFQVIVGTRRLGVR